MTELNSTYPVIAEPPTCRFCGSPAKAVANTCVSYACGASSLSTEGGACRIIAELRATVERLTRERDEAIRQRVDDVQAAQDRAEAFIEEHIEKLRASRDADTAIVAAAEAWRRHEYPDVRPGCSDDDLMDATGEVSTGLYEADLIRAIDVKRSQESNGEGADDE